MEANQVNIDKVKDAVTALNSVITTLEEVGEENLSFSLRSFALRVERISRSAATELKRQNGESVPGRKPGDKKG